MPKIWAIVSKIYNDVMTNHTMAMAAGLSYYFVMSIFPILILAAALLPYLPIPHLFGRILNAMSEVVPANSMGLVRAVLHDVVYAHQTSFLTIGIVGTLWTASSGFAALIEALNVAYDVPETRPIWKTRLLALQLMIVTGLMLILGTILMLVGPEFGGWISAKVGLSTEFAKAWPILRWGGAVILLVLAVELIFYWAPNVKHKFLWPLPGALIGVGFWIGTSFALGYYFNNFQGVNHTYGTLAAAVALMIWLYWSWFVILIGAELNSELLKDRVKGVPELKQPQPQPKPPSEANEQVAA